MTTIMEQGKIHSRYRKKRAWCCIFYEKIKTRKHKKIQ